MKGFSNNVDLQIDNEINRYRARDSKDTRIDCLIELRKNLHQHIASYVVNQFVNKQCPTKNLPVLHNNLTNTLKTYTNNWCADKGRDRVYFFLKHVLGVLLSLGELLCLSQKYRQTFFYTKARAGVAEKQNQFESFAQAEGVLKK